MALLTATVVSTSSIPAEGMVVRAELTDSRGAPIRGFNTSFGAYVSPSVAATDALGAISFDLTPNADIDPPLSQYKVTVGDDSFMITKTSSAQTLLEALTP